MKAFVCDFRKRLRKLDMKGSGSMLISVFFCLMAFAMMFLVMEFGGVYHTAAVAQTRADAIADAAASYALSPWDKNFNKTDAQFMAASMQTFNNLENKPISSKVKVYGSLPGEEDKIEVATKAYSRFYFIRPLGGTGEYTVERESAVETAPHTGGSGVVNVP